MSYNDPYLQFSADTTAKTFKFNHDEAQLARNFQKEMSSTSHQMEVADLQKAGLNPVLSANGGAAAYGASAASGQADSSGVSAKAQVASAAMSAQATMYAADANRDSSMFGLLGQYMDAAGLDPSTVAQIIQEDGAIGLLDALSGKARGSNPGTSAKNFLYNLSPAFSRTGLGQFVGTKLEKFGNFFGKGGYNDKGTEWSKLSSASKAEWTRKGHTAWEYNQGRALSRFKKNNPWTANYGQVDGLLNYFYNGEKRTKANTSAKSARQLNRVASSSIRALGKHASRTRK